MKSQHRILLRKLEFTAAEQFSVLVGFEIAGANDHRLRKKRSGDPANTFTEALDEKLVRILGADALASS